MIESVLKKIKKELIPEKDEIKQAIEESLESNKEKEINIWFNVSVMNKSCNFTFNSSSYSTTMSFEDYSDIKSQTFDDMYINISKKEVNSVLENIEKFSQNWDSFYKGNKDINWNLEIKKEGQVVSYRGEGKVPNNWNDVIDFLAEFEIKYKRKKAVDKKIQSEETAINDYDFGKASLYGFFIGDALGVPVEFINRATLKANKVIDMREFGTYNQPRGTWSDDSSMVLATIDGIINSEFPNIDYKKIMMDFLQWKNEGKYTPFNKLFDIGNTTNQALSVYERDTSNILCGLDNISSNGNGSLMRILPISLYIYYSGIENYSKKCLEIIKTISSMTHAHAYSILGCIIYTVFVNELLSVKNKYLAYQNMQYMVKEIIRENTEFSEAKEVYNRIIIENIFEFEESEIKSSGYVVDTLEAVFWCILTSNSFKESVLKAVNLGEDTDTIGALTGALAGIIYGYEDIPKEWINCLQRKEYLDEMINCFTNYLKKIKDNKSKAGFRNLIDETINELKNNPNACTTTGGTKSTDGAIVIQESMPSKKLSEFIQYLYENDLLDLDYNEDIEKIPEDKDVKDMTYEEVISKLTWAIREDRFCSGLLYSLVKDGTMLKLVERLSELT